MCITLIRIGATEMTDDVKIDYGALAEEAMNLSNDLMKIGHRFNKFGKLVSKIHEDFDRDFYDLKYSIMNNMERMAALYFELKDKE